MTRTAPSVFVLLTLAAGLSACRELKDAMSGAEAEANQTARQAAESAQQTKQAEAALAEKERAARASTLQDRESEREPDSRAEKVAWLVQRRIRCDRAACSDALLQRLRSLRDISVELAPLVDSKDDATQIEAARLVALLELTALAPKVIALLDDDTTSVRRAACHALGLLRYTPGAAAVGLRLLRAHDVDERLCLVSTLAQLGGTAAAEALSLAAARGEVRGALAAVRALTRLASNESVTLLRGALFESPHVEVKRAAADALRESPDTRARAILAQAARTGDSDTRHAVAPRRSK